jgi:hypothetical protein
MDCAINIKEEEIKEEEIVKNHLLPFLPAYDQDQLAR